MQNIYDIIKNVESIYEDTTAFHVLKDFERVLDELDIYVYDNWIDGELAEGPKIERHWITCKFFWPRAKMPDPMGGKRLLDYDCKITYQKATMAQPRKIRKPDDIRPGTRKGKLDNIPIWIVEIMMPKKLVADIYSSYAFDEELLADTAPDAAAAPPDEQPADATAGAGAGAIPGSAAPAPDAAPAADAGGGETL